MYVRTNRDQLMPLHSFSAFYAPIFLFWKDHWILQHSRRIGPDYHSLGLGRCDRQQLWLSGVVSQPPLVQPSYRTKDKGKRNSKYQKIFGPSGTNLG